MQWMDIYWDLYLVMAFFTFLSTSLDSLFGLFFMKLFTNFQHLSYILHYCFRLYTSIYIYIYIYWRYLWTCKIECMQFYSNHILATSLNICCLYHRQYKMIIPSDNSCHNAGRWGLTYSSLCHWTPHTNRDSCILVCMAKAPATCIMVIM